jgi:hypothetical protein
MRFSLIRLSPGQSTGRIPRRHSGWPPIPATHEAPRRVDSVLAVAVAHPARGPSLRRIMLSTPILATTPSSDFRSTLHHFAGHAYRFRCYQSTRGRHPPGPCCRCRDGSLLFHDGLCDRFRSQYADGSLVLHIQGLHTVHGLRPYLPGSAPVCLPLCGVDHDAVTGFLSYGPTTCSPPTATLSWRFDSRISPSAGHQLRGRLAATPAGLSPASPSQLPGHTRYRHLPLEIPRHQALKVTPRPARTPRQGHLQGRGHRMDPLGLRHRASAAPPAPRPRPRPGVPLPPPPGTLPAPTRP